MTDYTKSTNFATKDSLPPGSALKIVRGTEIDTEFNAIATAVATKADSSSVTTSLALKADLASPALTGTPTAPTPTAGDNDTSIATTAFVSTAVGALGNTFGFKNRIINGAMQIDQRNAGASVTQGTSYTYVMDRFAIRGTVTSKFTGQRSTTAPAGFVNSLLCTSSSAYSVGAAEAFFAGQIIEGLNCADLGWGTANAATVTLSFWVRSSLTGTFGGSLCNYAGDRSYPFTYVISAANTWEQKSVTIAGDQSGTWPTDNGGGIVLNIGLGAGSTLSGTAGAWAGALYRSATGAVSVVGTNGATFYITGVQLEKGSTATSFDYRPYGTELALCQRYYSVATTTTRFGSYSGVQYLRTTISTPAPMRASPTVTKLTNGTLSNTVAGNITYTSLSPTQFGFEVASSGTGDCYAIGGTASLESEL